MGSKDLFDDEDYRQHEAPKYEPEHQDFGGEQRGCHVIRDGDGCIGNGSTGQEDDEGGEDDDDDDDNDAAAAAALNETTTDGTKKKKRKRSKKKKAALKQSSPPRVPLHELFPAGEYPTGELMNYKPARLKSEERQQAVRDLEESGFLNDYRKAAEIHRQVRKWAQGAIKPGQGLTEVANGIEDGVRALLDNAGLETGDSLKSGLGFPTSLSVNNCVAHYTPNPGQKDIILKHEDVLKVDFGVHINGWIVDSAFTLAFDPTYDNLLAAVMDSTNTGIKTAGIDVRISDVSAAIQEVMESYEVEIRGKTYPVKPVRNLCGHDIQSYRIHGRKMIPFIKNSDQTKMEEGEIFAIETFGSTGRGYTRDGPGVYGYGLRKNPPPRVNMPLSSANKVYKTIKDNFGTVVFCRRYLSRLGLERYVAGLNCLVDHGVLEEYAPLMDVQGSYSAQFEHTILMRESTKEVISRGGDY